MNRLSRLMGGLEVHAQALQDAQLHQESMQTRFHNAMETGLHAALDQLLAIEKTASNLQGTVQDASQSVAKIASLVWVVSRFWTWGSLVVFLVVALFAVFQLDARFVRYIAAAIGRPSWFLSVFLTNHLCRDDGGHESIHGAFI